MKREITSQPKIPGHASFRAAKLWETFPPDRSSRIAISEGAVAHIPKRGGFTILNGNVWEAYFSPEGCLVEGPALLSMIPPEGVNKGVFRGQKSKDRWGFFWQTLGLSFLAAASWFMWFITAGFIVFGIIFFITLILGAFVTWKDLRCLGRGPSDLERHYAGRVRDYDAKTPAEIFAPLPEKVELGRHRL